MEIDLINMGNNPLNHEMEQAHKFITRTLNTAIKKLEGIRLNMPCSKEKGKRRSVALHLRAVLRLKRGIVVDEEIM